MHYNTTSNKFAFLINQPPPNGSAVKGARMTSYDKKLCERLKRLGFAQENRMRLYGQEFDLVSDPFIVENDVVFVDAIERKSRIQRRVRIPLPIVHMAGGERTAA